MTPTSLKSFVQLGALLAVLAAAGILATTTSTLSGPQVFAMIGFIAGGTAVAGGLALTSPTTSLIPHLVLILAVLALTVALAVKHVFGSTEVDGVFTFILGGGAVGAGSGIITAKVTAATLPPPPVGVPTHAVAVEHPPEEGTTP